MDSRRFGPDSPGEVVKTVGGLRAFVPDPLPTSWRFPDRLWPLLARAKQEIGILEGIGRVLPNPGLLLRPLRDREAFLSSRLEGTYVAPKDLLLFELSPREVDSPDDRANDWREVLNCSQALQYGITTELPLSLRLMRDLHRVLMTGVRGRDSRPGEFRSHQVAIGRPPRFVPPPPDRLTDCLDRFEAYLHATDSPHDPLVDCFLIHYQFEAIHPFGDGNGRIGRLLLALMVWHRGCLTKPWLYLTAHFERNRDEYFRRLFEVSASGDWDGWVEFCLHGTVTEAADTVRRCQRLLAIREEFGRRAVAAGGSVRLTALIEGLFDRPLVRIPEAAARLGVDYKTAQGDVNKLLKSGVLREVEGAYPRTFFPAELLEIVFETDVGGLGDGDYGPPESGG